MTFPVFCSRPTSVAQLSVINIAVIISACDKTLALERFHQNAVDGML